MIFKVVIFGHSFVRDIASLGRRVITLSNDVEFCLNYLSVPGASFATFLNDNKHFEHLRSLNPDFVIVLLGGNDLRIDTELAEVYKDCTKFYTRLREIVPDSIIIASQIENRFYKSENRFGSPVGENFDFLRRHFNRFLRNKPFKDFLLQVQGPNRLDKKENYRDCVHLNSLGLNKYFEIIKCTLSFAYNKRFVDK